MFQDTLLILKSDYIHKRRPVLLKLLSEDFQIQASRKLLFSPEHAAEFFKDYADEKGFMLEVILLSKGVSEAFIVTKENAVADLLSVMICYFGSSSEMECNVHVTKNVCNVAREINFIFPNYIHEPIEYFVKENFCHRPYLKNLISEIYHIILNVDTSKPNWRIQVAEWLTSSNADLPEISNQCNRKPMINSQEKGQQTAVSYTATLAAAKGPLLKKVGITDSSPSSVLSQTSPHSSVQLTSSSCVSCSAFERSAPCLPLVIDFDKKIEDSEKESVGAEEEIIWKEVIKYEEVSSEEEEEEHATLMDVEYEEEYSEHMAGPIQSDIEFRSAGSLDHVGQVESQLTRSEMQSAQDLPEPATDAEQQSHYTVADDKPADVESTAAAEPPPEPASVGDEPAPVPEGEEEGAA